MLALGFGSGLSPVAPGTAGTLLAWALGAVLLQGVPPLGLLAAIPVLFAVGVWACGITGRHLGVADHGGMVWDEIVAFLLVLAVLPPGFHWQIAGFVAFRVFDILKPPPIRWLERRYHGGFGVMADDILAALYALLLLAVAKRILL